jgi:hypothetical protein
MRQCRRIKWSRSDKRAKDEEKPFLEQLLQGGARKLLQTAINKEAIKMRATYFLNNVMIGDDFGGLSRCCL